MLYGTNTGNNTNTNSTINNDIRTNNNIPSIAYSCGTDCTAGLIVMPKNTHVCFLDRTIPLNKDSIYNKDNIYYTLDILINNNYNVNIIKTNMEYLREPVGFPVDIACGIPNILLSDIFGYDSIAYGYANHHKEFLESNIEYICTGTFKLYTNHYKPKTDEIIKKYQTYDFWNNLYKSVGLFLHFPIMGLTEIMTQKIVSKSILSGVIKSCMRGNIDKSCNRCMKCFKTNIVKTITNNGSIDNIKLNQIIKQIDNDIEKRYKITYDTIYEIKTLESIFLYIVNNYKDQVDNEIIEVLKNHFNNKYKKNKNLVLQWNSTSVEFIPQKYIDYISKNIMSQISQPTISTTSSQSIISSIL